MCVVISPFNVTSVRISGIHFHGHHISNMAATQRQCILT